MQLLDLFCGAGGAAMGYYRSGLVTDIVGVDIKPMPRYPFYFEQGDALEFLERYGQDFDLIHASPPCQRFSVATPNGYHKTHPDLITPFRKIAVMLDKPFIIENVMGARHKLMYPIKLCGSMFGLRVFRHRLFETLPAILLTPSCNHSFTPVYITGSTGCSGDFPRKDASISQKRIAIDIDWMVTAEIDEAIPPAYTEWIGKQLMNLL